MPLRPSVAQCWRNLFTRSMRERSLRTQIVAWSFVPTAIILLAVALVAFYAYQRSAADLVLQQSEELTRLSRQPALDQPARVHRRP